MTGKDIIPVQPELQDLLLEMTPQDVTLLIMKILHPEQTLAELSKDVWPEVGYAMRNKRIHASRVNVVIRNITANPYLLAMVLTSKLMPLAIATLHEGLAADKENVRVSAAKELIRFAQTTANKLKRDDDAPLPTEALDKELENVTEGEFREVEVDEDAGDSEPGDTGD